MKIIYLEQPASVELLRSEFLLTPDSESEAADSIVVCNSLHVKWALEERGIPLRLLDEWISFDDSMKIDQLGLEISKSWYLAESKDDSLFDGVSLGALMELDSQAFVTSFLKTAIALERLIKELNVSTIATDASPNGMRAHILASLSARYHFEVSFLVTSKNGISLKDALDRTFLDFCFLEFYGPEALSGSGERIMRRIAKLFVWEFLKILSLVPMATRKRRTRSYSEILLIQSSQIARIIKGWDLEKDAITLHFLDPAHFSIPLMFEGVSMPVKFEQLRRQSLDFNQAETLNRIRAAYSSENDKWISRLLSYYHDDLRLGDLLATFFEEFAKCRVERIAELILQLKAVFARNLISLVVVPNDTVEFTKALVTVARKHGIRSAVVQHGYHGYRADGDKRSADHILVWGQIDKSIYCSEGISNDKIFVTGSPNFDSYPPLSTSSRPMLRPEDVKRVVILTSGFAGQSSYFDLRVYENFVPSVARVLKLAGFRGDIVVKVHPSEKEEVYLRAVKDLGNATVVRNASLAQVLGKADLVISALSTAVFEALCLGIPTIVYNMGKGKWVNPPPLDGRSGILVAYNENDLKEGIEAIYSNGSTTSTSFDLSAYLGPVDGRAASRIRSVLVSLSRGED